MELGLSEMTLMVSEHTFAAIDFESAGADRGKTDVPVQIGMATWSLAAGHADHFTSFIRADQNITWSAQKVHGISRDDLADAPALMLLWPSIKCHLVGACRCGSRPRHRKTLLTRLSQSRLWPMG